MHGRLKVYTTEEQKLIKKKEQQKQVAAYRQGFKQVLKSRNPDGYGTESLQVCAKILMRQPDVYTLWNYRKEAALLQLAKLESDPDDVQTFLQNEVELTQQCLVANPKSYSSWHHRYWILTQHPEANWHHELTLCCQYLTADERNFHCWDYRRLVLQKVGVPLLEEITFSTDRININFSNYSSWHYRSTLKFLDAVTLPEELTLIQNAVYTDPYDSSPWFYLRWVLSDSNLTPKLHEETLSGLNQLAELERDCKWVLMALCWLVVDTTKKDEIYKKLAKLDVLRRGHYLQG